MFEYSVICEIWGELNWPRMHVLNRDGEVEESLEAGFNPSQAFEYFPEIPDDVSLGKDCRVVSGWFLAVGFGGMQPLAPWEWMVARVESAS